MGNRKEIKYIGFYDLPNSPYRRASSLAATNKMDYICDAINRSGFDVHLVSPSWITETSPVAKWQKTTTISINRHTKLTLCPSITTKSKPAKILKIALTQLWLFIFLIMNTNKDERVLVYHTPWLSLPIRMAKQIRRFHLILEVEEIYGQVWNIRNLLRKNEVKLISCADRYITVSEIMALMLGKKPTIILYGSYGNRKVQIETKINNLINVVYAGSIDHIKGGAYNAVECAKYLDSKYVVNILGFGNKQEIKELKSKIEEVNKVVGRQACIYHGVKVGKDYSTFLAGCHIGINPQTSGEYMMTAFPSKVLSYLTHDLLVVSTPISSIEKSTIAHLVVFSKDDSPEAIASAIHTVNVGKDFNSRSVINELDKKFVKEIRGLISS